MPGLPFTLRQLEVFERLCELRSFRLASEELGISQASVSNQLKALEDQLGVRLLTRESGKRPHLTPEGTAFLADLGKFWQAAGELASHRRAFAEDGTEMRQLRVLVGNYLLQDYIRPKLDQFFESQPNIQLNFICPRISDIPRTMIARESFDLAMFQEPPDTPMGDGFRELGTVRCGVFGHRKFAHGRNSHLSADELSKLPFILPPAGTYYEAETLNLLARQGIKPTDVMGRTQYFDVMSSMFERGVCVGVTLEALVSRERNRNTVLLCHLEDWLLTFYRNPRVGDPQIDAAEQFLVSAVVDDPTYPFVSRAH